MLAPQPRHPWRGGWEDGGVILLGTVLALFIAWALVVITTVWAIVRIVVFSLRVLWLLVFAFVRFAAATRPRRRVGRVVVLDR
jgi:hypothetical protein